LLSFLLSLPAQAATPTVERTPLTVELLQERINSPVQIEGLETIDLRQLIIDLTNENTKFRDQFYKQLQSQSNRSKTAIGIDLSESVIQGEFTASQLGLQTSLSQGALPSLLTPTEREKLQQDALFLSEPGEQIPSVTVFRGHLTLKQTRLNGAVNFANTFFLEGVEASEADFLQEVDLSSTRFAGAADWNNTQFSRDVNLSSSTFFDNAGFNQVQFQGVANFSGSTFHADANFSQAEFHELANFSRTQWLQNADFSQLRCRDRLLLNDSRFSQSLVLVDATLEKSTTFRGSEFRQTVLLRDVSLLDQVDFSNIRFAPGAYLNVAGLTFDSDQAKVFGDTGEIGNFISVPRLEGNEEVLHNLVRNFREQEKIPDANRIEYTMERLRQQMLCGRIMASSFVDFLKVSWLINSLHWFGLSIILLLSADGTSISLVFGVGIIAIAYFGVMFWLIDRWRRRYPKPILPNSLEIIYMGTSFALINCTGIATIFSSSEQPWLTLLSLIGILGPIPLLLVWRLYQQGRYHDMLNATYFVEDGGPRQLRILIARLPIIPRFAFFRDRYMPILWNRRWNWLNYYDFSLNNWLKFGFNDIRLRDEHLPGIITTLVWYQWSLGIGYIALLLWTISRTIPGLNLLIYF